MSEESVSRRPRIRARDIPKLIRFYLACVEEEDRRALTLRLGQFRRSWCAPFRGPEPLFSGRWQSDPHALLFRVRSRDERRFFTAGALAAGEAARFYYGYPIFIDERDQLAPLFYLEVEVSQTDSGSFRIEGFDVTRLQLNHHVLRARGVPPEQVAVVQEELEGTFGSFPARLRAAFELLGEREAPPDGSRIDAVPQPGHRASRWLGLPILFRSERTAYTQHLRRELEALVRYERLLEAIPRTALGTLLGTSEGPGSSGHSRLRLSRTNRPAAGPSPPDPVAIVPLNERQLEAARASLAAPLTVITGPPGTGKSQVVLNLLATGAWSGQAILFASKNNKAVDVVRDRLSELLGVDDWSLRLGSRAHVEKTKDLLLERLEGLPPREGRTARTSAPRETRMRELATRVERARKTLAGLGSAVEELRQQEEDLRVLASRLPFDWREAPRSHAPLPPELARGISTWTRRLRWLEASRLPRGARRLFWVAARPWVRKRAASLLSQLAVSLPRCETTEWLTARDPRWSWMPWLERLQEASKYVDYVAAKERLEQLREKIAKLPEAADLEKEIRSANEELARLWRQQLAERWTARLAAEHPRVATALRGYFEDLDRLRNLQGRDFAVALDNLSRSVQRLGRYLPVWIVTSLSTRRSVPLQPALFDLLVIDEASQCDIASALPLFFRARRAVVIGDPKQLRHISSLAPARERELAEQHGVSHALHVWSYGARSLYDLASEVAEQSGNAPIFLAEHYRSHPDVIVFSNQTFYAGRLVLRSSVASFLEKLPTKEIGLFWHPVQGRVPRSPRSAWNPEEIDRIVRLLQGWWQQGWLSEGQIEIGIVTPFRLQADQIEKRLLELSFAEELSRVVRIGTAHRFQGDERDVVIFSPVVSQGLAPKLTRWVADTEQLLNVALTRARCALHITGNLDACERAGGALAELARFVKQMGITGEPAPDPESDAEWEVEALLRRMKLWYRRQYVVGPYRLDFLVISPLGRTYALEVDGAHHWEADQLERDAARDRFLKSRGILPLRIAARDVFERPEAVASVLRRLP